MSSATEAKELEFYRFVYERHSIYCKKIAGEHPPWTEDPVLQKYKFCCVFRELDKTSKYLIKTIIDNASLSISDKFLNIVLFRIFNRIGFFDEILDGPVTTASYNPRDIICQMDEAVKKKITLWGNAYMICGLRTRKHLRPGDKHVQVVYGLWDSLEDGVFAGILPKTIEEMYRRAWEAMFVGPFLAFQISVDMSYIEGVEYPDINSFVKVGPGAVASAHRIYETASMEDRELEDLNRRLYLAQSRCWSVLREREGKCFRTLLKKQKGIGQCRTIAWNSELPVRLSDCENMMCEYRKFYNLFTGAKQRVRLYHYA